MLDLWAEFGRRCGGRRRAIPTTRWSSSATLSSFVFCFWACTLAQGKAEALVDLRGVYSAPSLTGDRSLRRQTQMVEGLEQTPRRQENALEGSKLDFRRWRRAVC